ncbi:MAG: alpha/beta fold hydrolase [Anaerolineaceae bacterium]|jgi:carboxylesterase|nr:alpha/beta fold hydrolase [Anaerolineaceae bacterium]HOG77745.1 alpha/beta fold hydrolase [Anaerolineaceae bacterium]
MTVNEYMKNPHLDGDSFLLEGGRVGVVLFHGLTATTAEVRLLGEHLHSLGYTISAPLLPGHGTHPDKLNRCKWMDWYESAEAAFLEMRERSDKVFIGGESMGALLALLIASRYEQVAGVFLAAPALKIRNLEAAYLLQHFIRYMDKHQAEDNLPWKGYNVYPVKSLAQLGKLQNVVKKELPAVTQPLLVFIGGKDKSVQPATGNLIMSRVNSKDRRLIQMQNSPHVMLLAEERHHIFSQTAAFIHALV